MTDRRTEIIKAAIDLIVDQGYSCLTMRALAREVGMKLASLQYHFKTTDELMRAVVSHIGDAYDRSFDAIRDGNEAMTVRHIARFILDDTAGKDLCSDRLWPQLWAMQQVEPHVSELVEDIYAKYLSALEEALHRAGASQPRADALCLMAMLEGTTIFVGEGRGWEKDAKEVGKAVFRIIENNWSNNQ